jgi:hypothetical protein
LARLPLHQRSGVGEAQLLFENLIVQSPRHAQHFQQRDFVSGALSMPGCSDRKKSRKSLFR